MKPAQNIDMILEEIREFREHIQANSSSHPEVILGQCIAAVIVDAKTADILHVTSAAAALLGYSVEELEKKSVHSLVPPPQRELHRIQFREFVRKPYALPAGRNVFAQRKDGTQVLVNLWLELAEIGGRQVGVAYLFHMGSDVDGCSLSREDTEEG